MVAPSKAEEWTIGHVADADGVLRVRVEPGRSMRWFSQGFFMGLGFATATFVIWLVIGMIILMSVSD
jgi:F0F1-type ATP synthase membrane subunit c/vacuolar-type H+-ATPase subunit K